MVATASALIFGFVDLINFEYISSPFNVLTFESGLGWPRRTTETNT